MKRFLHQRLAAVRLSALFLLLSTGWLAAEQGLRREVWNNLDGPTEKKLTERPAFYGPPLSLTTNPAFYGPPATEEVLAGAIAATGNGGNSGTRLRGYLLAPTTGDYLFWESGSDTVAVYLSIDENPTGKRMIVSHNSTADLGRYQPQKSAPIRLVAGKKYYLEIIQKSDDTRGDLMLSWQPPGGHPQIIPDSVLETYVPPKPNPAGLTREFFPNLPGTSIADLTGTPAFYRLPASADTIPSPTFSNFGGNYGLRLRGYLTAPVSGDYTFWECGSGAVSVNLGTDENATAVHQSVQVNDRPNKRELAHHDGAVPPFANPVGKTEFSTQSRQRSKPVKLIAGKKYYFEILFKAGEGADFLSVLWQLPGREPEPIPLSALESYRRPATDLDDDGMPDALERLHGLNPTDAADAAGDLDGDGIFNDEEIRSGCNPAERGSVPGLVVDDVWHQVSGDKLDQGTYRVAYTRPIGSRSAAVISKIHGGGAGSIRRIRGYVTPPVTDTYDFWAGANGDCAFYLSSTTSKFDRQLLIKPAGRNPYGKLDVDLSQKSASVRLVAGQKYYFEFWVKHNGGSPIARLAWQFPGETRQSIAARFLSSYEGDANDRDDDDLPDDWERANGLNPADDGRRAMASDGTPVGGPSRDGGFGDLDGDGLSNGEERTYRTQANAVDSDGDGMGDGDEIFIHSDPLFKDLDAFNAILRGDAFTTRLGEWERLDGQAWQLCRRGSVTYPLAVPRSGVHAVKFTVSSRAGGNLSEAYDFRISINGRPVSFQTTVIPENGTANFAILTPWLNAGEDNQCEIFVDNSFNSRRISVDQLQIFAAGGPDANTDGIPDWVETRLRDNNGFDSLLIHSRTSPATVEGRARYFDFLNTNGVAATRAPNGRFFTDLTLNPNAPASLQFAFENGGLSQTAKVHWEPTNLRQLDVKGLTVRQGDSLLLTAFLNVSRADQESYTISVNGETVTNSGDHPTPVAFPTPGTQTIQLTHSDGLASVTTRSFTVTVLPRVAMESPLCVTDFARAWTHSPLPEGTEIGWDGAVAATREVAANTYTLLTTTPEDRPLLIRHTSSGAILGSATVKSVRVRTNGMTGNILERYGDPASTFLMPVVVSGDLDGAEVRCRVLIGGVTFVDGTLTNSLWASDFDVFGTGGLRFLVANTASTNCRQFSVWKNGTRLAVFDDARDPNDLDNDELPDDWEKANGSPANLANGGDDLDGDGLTNRQEFLRGTRADVADTDGDGVNDFDELRFYRSNPLVKDVAPPVKLADLPLGAYKAAPGNWLQAGGSLHSMTRRGTAEFSFNLESPGVYLVELQAAAHTAGGYVPSVPVIGRMDGAEIGRAIVKSGGSRHRWLTSWLPAGTHTVTIDNRNVRMGVALEISSVTIFAHAGVDANGDGVPDWLARLLKDDNRFALGSSESATSPACLEGIARYSGDVRISGPGGDIAVHPGLDGHWFANVPLNPSGETKIDGAFENGSVREEHTISWTVTNLFGAPDTLRVRVGDSLKIAALPAGSDPTATVATLSRDGEPLGGGSAADPRIVKFDQPGIVTLAAVAVTGQETQETSMKIEVVAADFGPAFSVAAGAARTWNLPGLERTLVLEADAGLGLEEIDSLPPSARRVAVTYPASKSGSPRVLARLWKDGPIAAATTINAFWFVPATATGNHRVIEVLADGTRVVEVRYVIDGPIPADLSIWLQMYVTDAVFADGSTWHELTAADFNANGEARLLIYKAPGKGIPYVCHWIRPFHKDAATP